ncbi:hypothetical protein [Modestobacter sp. Leaf380]|uniref:hypothetical protein n=1 Tax=Modestobacter sp. Leaf380 TaxID=1736356 RepID=UPI001F3773B2|nr:hypothetical protein [Modestobacter sp. Leaf380]
MTEPRPQPTGATGSAADPTRPVGASPAPVDPAPRADAGPEDRTRVDQTRVDHTPPRDPVAEQTTAVHPLPERHRDETLPGTTRAAHVPTDPAPERTTWHPDSDVDRTTPAWSTEPVAVRRADSVAAFLLLLAGVAAGISLLLPWTPEGRTGLDLLRDGLDQLATDWTGVFDAGLWQPLAVVFGGGVLFLLGLLLLVPAKSHRFLGVLALLVALAVLAGGLVPLADTGWDLADYDIGFSFALAVAGLGLLGALKAALTGRKHA